jgi:large subunit ribosomal protein L16
VPPFLQRSCLKKTFEKIEYICLKKKERSPFFFWKSKKEPKRNTIFSSSFFFEKYQKKKVFHWFSLKNSFSVHSRLFFMLSPKRTKFRRPHRGNLKGKASRGTKIAFGEYGLQALEPCWITSRQIESGRRVLTRYVRRTGKLWIRIFPDKPITMRPAGTRMGSGKGFPEYWVAVVHPGKILYEIQGVPEPIAKQALRTAAYKMPIQTKFVKAEPKKEKI